MGTRTYHEELDLGKVEPRHPPNTYEEAKLSAGTFTALQFALVGSESPWYLACLRSRRMFDNEMVKLEKKEFNGIRLRNRSTYLFRSRSALIGRTRPVGRVEFNVHSLDLDSRSRLAP